MSERRVLVWISLRRDSYGSDFSLDFKKILLSFSFGVGVMNGRSRNSTNSQQMVLFIFYIHTLILLHVHSIILFNERKTPACKISHLFLKQKTNHCTLLLYMMIITILLNLNATTHTHTHTHRKSSLPLRIPFLFIVGVPLCIPFLFIAVFYSPNTILTNAITRSHENAVKRYE